MQPEQPRDDIHEKKPQEPPSTLSLRYCPACGRTDRVNHLPGTHYTEGRRCDGPILVARYRRTAQ
jgi:hypothetical protein